MPAETVRELVRNLLIEWGPEQRGEPPQEMADLVLRLILRYAAKRIPCVLNGDSPADAECPALEQVVIAFGLGWRRQIRFAPDAPIPRGWAGVWNRAEKWLEQRMFVAMRRTSRYLEFGLCVQGYAFNHHPELRHEIAQQMALWFITGTCPCPQLCLKHSKTGAALTNFEHRTRRHLRQHNVMAWLPAKQSFTDFVFQAVKGIKPSGSQNFLPGSLVQGMHFYNLYEFSHIRFGPVLVWVCPEDQTLNFEGLSCLRCREEGRGDAVKPAAFRTLLRRLLVPRTWGGRYEEASYIHCHYCKQIFSGYPGFPGEHYYPAHLPQCPRCGKPRGPGSRKSRVYLLTPRDDSRVLQATEAEASAKQALTTLAGIQPIPEAATVEGPAFGQIRKQHLSGGDETVLRAAIAKLAPLEQRLIGLLRRGFALDEAAQELGLSLEEVTKLHKSAMKNLRNALGIGPEGDDDL